MGGERERGCCYKGESMVATGIDNLREDVVLIRGW